jgi:hypothetical protein
MSGQLHAPAALFPAANEYDGVGPRAALDVLEKGICPESNHDSPTVQLVTLSLYWLASRTGG